MRYEWEFRDPGNPNHQAQYDRLPDDQKQLLQDWIADRIKPASSYQHKRTSYGLKHDFQRETGLWVNNGAFKGGMLAAGFKPYSDLEMNPSYRIRTIADARRGKERPPSGWWASEHGIQVNYGAQGKASLISLPAESMD